MEVQKVTRDYVIIDGEKIYFDEPFDQGRPMKLYMPGEAAERFGLSRRSLLRYEEDGLIEPVRTPGGQRRYPESELLRLYGLEAKTKRAGDRAGLYSRVSTRKQADAGNLEHQTRRLKEYAQTAGYEIVEVYEEIASGLNENRRQLRKLLKAVIAGKINIVVVEYKDRLARFGYAYLEMLCESHGARIEVIEEKASNDENAVRNFNLPGARDQAAIRSLSRESP